MARSKIYLRRVYAIFSERDIRWNYHRSKQSIENNGGNMNNLSYKDVKSIAFGRSNRKYHWPIGPNAKWCAWLSLIFIVLWFIAITVLLIQTSSVTNNYKLTYDIPTSGALVLGGHDGVDLLDGHLIKPTVDPDAYEWVLSNWVLTPIMT